MRKLKSFLNILLLLALAFSLCGCAAMVGAAAGGAGTALWLSGKLSEEINAPYEKTTGAVKRALHSLKMEVVKEIKAEDVTQIKSEYADGSTVWIDIRPLTAKSSKIDIRVGLKGDKDASGKILEAISKRL